MNCNFIFPNQKCINIILIYTCINKRRNTNTTEHAIQKQYDSLHCTMNPTTLQQHGTANIIQNNYDQRTTHAARRTTHDARRRTTNNIHSIRSIHSVHSIHSVRCVHSVHSIHSIQGLDTKGVEKSSFCHEKCRKVTKSQALDTKSDEK